MIVRFVLGGQAAWSAGAILGFVFFFFKKI